MVVTNKIYIPTTTSPSGVSGAVSRAHLILKDSAENVANIGENIKGEISV